MNNMPSKKSIISLALGSAFAATLGTASVASAADNPFAAQSLQEGFTVASSHYDDKGGYGDRKDGYGEKKYGEGRCGMSMADTDNDGRVSRDEHARHAEKMFDKMDTNRDGYIDKDEASAMRKKYRDHGHGHGHGHEQGYRDQYRSGDQYRGSGDQYRGSGDQYRGDQYRRDQSRGERDGGVDVHRYREYGAGDKVPRDLEHMRPMGE